MIKSRHIGQLNVDVIGGEELTQAEKQLLSSYFREKKAKRQKRVKALESKSKKTVSS